MQLVTGLSMEMLLWWKSSPLNSGRYFIKMYNPNQKKLGRYGNANKKRKVVITKFTLTCISLQTIWTQNISCFVWSTSCHCKYTSFPVIQTCNTFQKSWDSKAFTTCNVAIPFHKLKRRLGDWRHQVMKCFRCNFVPFFLQTSLKVGNSTGSSLSHFCASNVPHILYWRQVGTAGRPVKYPYPLPPQPGLCNVCRMWFCIVLLKYAWTSWKDVFLKAAYLLQNLYVLFSINGCHHRSASYLCQGPDTTPYHDRPWLLDLLLVTVWMILFFFGPEHTASILPKIPEILIHLTTVQVSTVWWSIPDASEPREVDGASGHCYIGLPFGTVQF